MTVVAVGMGLVLAGLTLGLLDTHLRRAKAWDRPAWAMTAAYRSLSRAVPRVLLAAGVLVTFSGSVVAGGVLSAAILAIWGRWRWVRSARYRAWILRRRHEQLRGASAEMTEHELLRTLVLEQHPDWGVELADQIAADSPDVASLARVLVRMEKGWARVE